MTRDLDQLADYLVRECGCDRAEVVGDGVLAHRPRAARRRVWHVERLDGSFCRFTRKADAIAWLNGAATPHPGF